MTEEKIGHDKPLHIKMQVDWQHTCPQEMATLRQLGIKQHFAELTAQCVNLLLASKMPLLSPPSVVLDTGDRARAASARFWRLAARSLAQMDSGSNNAHRASSSHIATGMDSTEQTAKSLDAPDRSSSQRGTGSGRSVRRTTKGHGASSPWPVGKSMLMHWIPAVQVRRSK